jgi:methylisocitrate lyase
MQVGGFDALYMVCLERPLVRRFVTDKHQTGAGTSASRLGVADLGIAHLHDMRANAEMIANLDPNGPPLIADMDTGYGGEQSHCRLLCFFVSAC